MKLHQILVAASVLGIVSVASAGQRWAVEKQAVETHPSMRLACLRATQFAETSLLAQCRASNARLTVVEGRDCQCEHHGEYTCAAVAKGYCDR